jgi:hypothetical protein
LLRHEELGEGLILRSSCRLVSAVVPVREEIRDQQARFLVQTSAMDPSALRN